MLDLKLAIEGQPPRVLVVSEVLLYREGVARGLDQTGRYCVVGAADGSEALVILASQPIDAVLLDASTEAALSVARALRERCDSVPVIGFGIGSDAGSLACAEAGFRGFVGRDGSIIELADAIERALVGEVLCSTRLAALLCDRLEILSGGAPSDQPASPLTRREQEIALLVGEGLSNKEIAIELRIGPATVKNHIHSILEKLQVARRSGIAFRLQQGRLLPDRNALATR